MFRGRMLYNVLRVSEVRAKRGFGRRYEVSKPDTRLLSEPDRAEAEGERSWSKGISGTSIVFLPVFLPYDIHIYLFNFLF